MSGKSYLGRLLLALICFFGCIILLFNLDDHPGWFFLLFVVGLVLGICDLVTLVKIYKNEFKGEQGALQYIGANFKKKNGKGMFNLSISALFACVPLFILLIIIVIAGGGAILGALGNSSSSSSSSDSSGGSSSGVGKSVLNAIGNVSTSGGGGKSSGSSSDIDMTSVDDDDDDTYTGMTNEEINRTVKGIHNDGMQYVNDNVHERLQQLKRENPSLTDEELTDLAREKINTGLTVNTVRAHTADADITYEDVSNSARFSSNNQQSTTRNQFERLQKLKRENPSLSDEELTEKARETIGSSLNVETVRANTAGVHMTNAEINKSAGRSDNKLKYLSDKDHERIQKLWRENPGMSEEALTEKARKINSGWNVETVRAHKP